MVIGCVAVQLKKSSAILLFKKCWLIAKQRFLSFKQIIKTLSELIIICTGLDLNMRNNEGQSVGHVMVLFAMNSSLHFVLKQRLIDPTVKDNNGDNLLDYAIRLHFRTGNDCMSYDLKMKWISKNNENYITANKPGRVDFNDIGFLKCLFFCTLVSY